MGTAVGCGWHAHTTNEIVARRAVLMRLVNPK
jgi:hypothetical protein